MKSPASSTSIGHRSGLAGPRDKYLQHILRDLNLACDLFWSRTEERRAIHRRYLATHEYLGKKIPSPPTSANFNDFEIS
jgi:hypothetical protein